MIGTKGIHHFSALYNRQLINLMSYAKMKPIDQNPSFGELFEDFNIVISAYGYSPIIQVTDLTWKQWLNLSSLLHVKGCLAEANVAKWIGLDLKQS